MHFDIGGSAFLTLVQMMAGEWRIVPYPKGPSAEDNKWMVGGAK